LAKPNGLPPRLYVLAAHEPTLDPRIDWVPRFAADRFDVTVFGTADHLRPEPPIETCHGYQIVRLTRSLRGCFTTAGGCARYLMASWRFGLVLLAALLASLFLMLPWLIHETVRTLLRLVLRHLSPVSAERRLAAGIKPTWFSQMGKRLYWHVRHFGAATITLCQGIRKEPRPDLIYCNDLDTLLAGVLLKRVFGCKLIYDAHEFWARSDSRSASWEVWLLLHYEKELLRQVDAAFTVNHMLAEQMQIALGHPFASLPNCEPVTAPTPRRAAPATEVASMRARASIKEFASGRVCFLYQGLFLPDRGILELLRAWRRVDTGRAALFLRGPDNMHKPPCVDLARDLGILGTSVFFLDPIREDELVAGAAEADVGIIPYKAVNINNRYCCPNKLSQYMHAGLAILANDLDFVKYTIERFQCGITYNVDDESSVFSAIQRLIEDEGLRRHCQRQAKLMVIKEYNWENVSLPLYETLMRLADDGTSAGANQRLTARVA
jgi:glycosyltransferase involved in cell wall biosynthesis